MQSSQTALSSSYGLPVQPRTEIPTSKIIVFCGPSGAGKTSIAKEILRSNYKFQPSVSCTDRSPRKGEKHGEDYIFLTPQEFQKKKSEGEFLETEEVYTGKNYGTLVSSVDEIHKKGKYPLFDVDIKGAARLKNKYGDKAFVIFVAPVNLEVLEERLSNRKTEDKESFISRMERAKMEIGYKDSFDFCLVNDELTRAIDEAHERIHRFLRR